MFGSAMFVINPPWQLAAQLEEAMPVLEQLLGDGTNSQFELNSAIA